MMKTLKFAGMVLLTIFMSFTLASCGDDDDDEGSTPVATSSLVGHWVQTWEKGYEKWGDGYTDEWDNAVSDYHIILNTDGTGQDYEEGDPYSRGYFNWDLKSGKLYFTYNDDKGIIEAYTVKISGSTMTLEDYGKDAKGEYYSIDTFKKVQ